MAKGQQGPTLHAAVVGGCQREVEVVHLCRREGGEFSNASQLARLWWIYLLCTCKLATSWPQLADTAGHIWGATRDRLQAQA